MRSEDELFDKYLFLQQLTNALRNKRIAEYGPMGDTMRGRGRVLAFLQQKDGIGVRNLATILGIRVSSLNEVLLKMSKEGLIERVPSPDDGRIMLVMLTEKGREYQLAENDMAHLMFGSLDINTQSELSDYFEQMIASLTKDLGDEADPIMEARELRAQFLGLESPRAAAEAATKAEAEAAIKAEAEAVEAAQAEAVARAAEEEVMRIVAGAAAAEAAAAEVAKVAAEEAAMLEAEALAQAEAEAAAVEEIARIEAEVEAQAEVEELVRLRVEEAAEEDAKRIEEDAIAKEAAEQAAFEAEAQIEARVQQEAEAQLKTETQQEAEIQKIETGIEAQGEKEMSEPQPVVPVTPAIPVQSQPQEQKGSLKKLFGRITSSFTSQDNIPPAPPAPPAH